MPPSCRTTVTSQKSAQASVYRLGGHVQGWVQPQCIAAGHANIIFEPNRVRITRAGLAASIQELAGLFPGTGSELRLGLRPELWQSWKSDT